jgi:hypothetical protein
VAVVDLETEREAQIERKVMNEIDKLLGFVPEKYRPYLMLTVMLSPYVTRSIYAIMQGGGLKGILRAIWLGTNAPKPTPPTS